MTKRWYRATMRETRAIGTLRTLTPGTAVAVRRGTLPDDVIVRPLVGNWGEWCLSTRADAARAMTLEGLLTGRELAAVERNEERYAWEMSR